MSQKRPRGFILFQPDGRPIFRFKHKDGTFRDCKIAHSDLEVEIVGEHDFYLVGVPEGTRWVLDHSRQTLGLPDPD